MASHSKMNHSVKAALTDRDIGGSRQSRCTRRLQNSHATNRPPCPPHAIQHWSPAA